MQELSLDSQQTAEMMQAFYGEKFIWAKGNNIASVYYTEGGMLPLLAYFPRFDTPHAGGVVVVLFGRNDGRLQFLDPNLNYGLHTQAAQGAAGFDWLWVDGKVTEPNPIPAGIEPRYVNLSAGFASIEFVNRENGLPFGNPPRPHFVRHNPTRRMESWNGGTFSILPEDLNHADPKMLVPKSFADEHNRRAAENLRQIVQDRNIFHDPKGLLLASLASVSVWVLGSRVGGLLRGKKSAEGSGSSDEK